MAKKRIPKGFRFLGYYPKKDAKSLAKDLNAVIKTGKKRDDGDVPFYFKNKIRR